MKKLSKALSIISYFTFFAACSDASRSNDFTSSQDDRRPIGPFLQLSTQTRSTLQSQASCEPLPISTLHRAVSHVLAQEAKISLTAKEYFRLGGNRPPTPQDWTPITPSSASRSSFFSDRGNAVLGLGQRSLSQCSINSSSASSAHPKQQTFLSQILPSRKQQYTASNRVPAKQTETSSHPNHLEKDT